MRPLHTTGLSFAGDSGRRYPMDIVGMSLFVKGIKAPATRKHVHQLWPEVRNQEKRVLVVRFGSPMFSKPMSFGTDGPKTSRSRIPIFERGRVVASAYAKFTISQGQTVSLSSWRVTAHQRRCFSQHLLYRRLQQQHAEHMGSCVWVQVQYRDVELTGLVCRKIAAGPRYRAQMRILTGQSRNFKHQWIFMKNCGWSMKLTNKKLARNWWTKV